jgi:NAD(P)-dependent dehydrogenase (short-subunit alcohol dehydrogenase family)
LGKTTVLITGGAGSLGSALALCCARAGYETALLDSDRRGLEALSDRLAERGLAEPLLHPLDLSTAGPDEFQATLDAIERECGGVDALVHCAVRFQGLTPLEHIQPQEWLLQLQVNLNAAWLLSALCLPRLRKSGAGRLYFMLEDLQQVGGAQWGAYGVSKHALRAMVGQLAVECQGSGVQVLGINPGPMRSPLRSRAYLAEHPAAQPEPAVVAERIMEFLSGRRQPSGVYVNLAMPGAGTGE